MTPFAALDGTPFTAATISKVSSLLVTLTGVDGASLTVMLSSNTGSLIKRKKAADYKTYQVTTRPKAKISIERSTNPFGAHLIMLRRTE
jgi:hypothetical protein